MQTFQKELKSIKLKKKTKYSKQLEQQAPKMPKGQRNTHTYGH